MMKHLRNWAGVFMSCVLSLSVLTSAMSRELGTALTVSGTVTGKADGLPIPGVNVQIKGTSRGTTTDGEGRYTIQVDNESAVLVFSFIGFATEEATVGTRTVIDVALTEDVTKLSEVVVTALGVSKESRKIGYAVATVSGEQFNKARESNVALSLQGTVAGLNVRGSNGGPGGSANILLRGMPSMNSGGAPLFIINGVPMDNTQRGSAGEWGGSDNGDGIGNLNPDDIETMTVLKGQSASALYGARASNGVIMITTKKGAKNDFSVEYNMNYMTDHAMNLTDFQYEYGQGQNGAKPLTIDKALESTRLSWGAKLDGSQMLQFDGKQYAYSAQKDNIKNFYRTGSSFTNTISVSKGGENGSVRLSVSSLDNKSIVPNSGLDRKTFNLNVDQKITPKLSVTAVANYIFEKSTARPQLSDGPMNANNGLFLATNIDQRILSPGYNTVTGAEVRWSDDEYVTNPYFVVNQYVNNPQRKRLISSASAKYQFADWIYAQARIGYDQQNDKLLKVTPWGTAYSQNLAGGLDEQSQAQGYELNVDGLIGIDKNITTDFSVEALLGANMRRNEYEWVKIGGGPFILPYMYSYNNVLNFNRDYSYFKKGVNSGYYSVDFSYKDFIILSTTGRYDDYSTLYSLNNPSKKTGIFTKSVSASLLFSELIDVHPLSFGKLRVSYAETSGEPDKAYQTSLFYSPNNSLGGIPLGSFKDTAPNYYLNPFVNREFEIGTDLKFFDNRLGIDFAWYTRKTLDEIMTTNYTVTSGARGGYIGTGSTQNSGIEIQLKGTPVKNSNLSWDVTLTMTSVKNKILATNADNSNISQGSNRATLGNAITAFVVGSAGPQILAYDYARTSSGQIIVDDKGLPVRGKLIEMGSVVPKFYGGLNNQVTYKNFNVSFLIDYNFGNKVLSATEYYSILRGLNKMTLAGREEGVKVGVTENGSPNTVSAPAQSYYTTLAQQITSTSVVDGDFIKLRQFTLGYSVPSAWLTKVPLLRSVQISLVGRNLAILMRKAKNIDPEASFGSNVKYYGIEGTSLPSARSYGFNMNFKFK